MPGFFQPAGEVKEIRPFEEFPVPFPQGTLSGVVSTDELAAVLFVHYFISRALSMGRVYVLGPGRTVSPKILSTLGADASNVLVGSVYSPEELLSALSLVEDGAPVLISGLSLLDSSPMNIVEVRRVVDNKGLIGVLHNSPIVFNELDHPNEFTRLFKLPELFDSLIVLRTSSYRGHYRLNMTVFKAPPDLVALLGDHSIPVDSVVKPLLGKS
ncbi:hypothetical protein [Thermococcus sp.]